MTHDQGSIPDADVGHWVDRHAPPMARPYLRLMRVDRPIGIWLLFFPFSWALVLAAHPVSLPTLWLLLVFAVAATLLRGAGCTINDIVDHELDARVERTRSRPLPSGQVSVGRAAIFALVLFLGGVGAMLATNRFTWWLTFGSLVLIVVYPFMKRLTWWPQAFLGLTINWGALLGWAAVREEIGGPALLLYLGGAAWTFGYDSIYAHQDKRDDARSNIRSSALALGPRTKVVVAWCYVAAVLLIGAAGVVAGAGPWSWVILGLVGLSLLYQVLRVDLDDPASCLRAFKSNRNIGWWIFVALMSGRLLA